MRARVASSGNANGALAASANAADIQAKMKALRTVGVPYTDDQIAKAPADLAGKSEQDALVAYLQNLGLAMKNAR